MRRVTLAPRLDWQDQVERLGFTFHTLDGETYWDESVAYAFSLEQIERDIEAPTEAIEQLCFAFIERARRRRNGADAAGDPSCAA